MTQDTRWIALDCRMIAHTGVGTYIRNLLPHLPPPPGRREYLAISNPGLPSLASFRRVSVGVRPLSLGDQFLPWYLRRMSVDLLYVPHFNAPLFWRGPLVVTIHDLIPLVIPGAVSRVRRPVFRAWVSLVVRDAAAIVADSEHSRQDVIRVLGAIPEKVVVIPPAVGPEFRPLNNGERLAAFRNEPGRRFFLHVGRQKPHKNIPRLLRALRKVATRINDVALVVVGFTPPAELVREVERLGLRDRVRFAGYVGGADLIASYRTAIALVLPSLYEGFGLPALEAMACGTPVIASNRAALTEVVGEAGLLVNPEDEDSIAEAMVRVAEDSVLRLALRERGLAQAKRFSPQRSAARLAEVFSEVLVAGDS